MLQDPADEYPSASSVRIPALNQPDFDTIATSAFQLFSTCAVPDEHGELNISADRINGATVVKEERPYFLASARVRSAPAKQFCAGSPS